MPTKDEVAAIVAGMRMLDADGAADIAAADGYPPMMRRASSASTMATTATIKETAKDDLLSSYIAAEPNSRETDKQARDDENGGDEEEDDDGTFEDVDVIEEHPVDEAEPSVDKDDDDELLYQKVYGTLAVSEMNTFDDVDIEEHSVNNGAESLPLPEDTTEQQDIQPRPMLGINVICPQKQSHASKGDACSKLPIECPDSISMKRCNSHEDESNSSSNTTEEPGRRKSILQNIVDDFTPNKGDQKILRAIGRTATVNAAVLVTAATGGAAGAIGYVAGGAITAKRLSDGVIKNDEKEVTKSLAVFGCATGASIAGQAITGALMVGLAGASLPLAGAVAFGVGCCSGVTAGALSEWTVDSVMDRLKNGRRKNKKSSEGAVTKSVMQRSKSDGALLKNDSTESYSSQEERSEATIRRLSFGL